MTHDTQLTSAMALYAKGEISEERAAELAGLSRAAFLRALAATKVPVFHVDFDDLRREINIE